MDTDREMLSLEPIANDAEVGRWLAALEEPIGKRCARKQYRSVTKPG